MGLDHLISGEQVSY